MHAITYITFPLALLFLLLQQWLAAAVFLALTIVAAAVDLLLERRQPAAAPVSRLRRVASLAHFGIIAGLATAAAVTMVSIAWW